MTDVDEQGRPEPPSQGTEQATLLGFLEFQRATFDWRCRGLDASGLRAALPPSTMTLGGMRKHLALVEEWWFHEWLLGGAPLAPWSAIDWDATPDWDWDSATEDTPEQLEQLWSEAVERSRAAVDQVLSVGDLSTLAVRTGTRTPSLRWILCHMIEEYARHNGHADLLRQSIDGETGE